MRPILASPEPIALGLSTAESAHSFVRRIAAAYCVPIKSVALTCARAGGAITCSRHDYVKPPEWLGPGQLPMHLAKGLELLSGAPGSNMTTLRLRTLIGKSRELISRQFRLCPICIQPDSGIEHGMIAHQMSFVLTCPEHSCQLIEECPKCSSRISPWNDYFTDACCRRCGCDLSKEALPEASQDAFSIWRSRQMHEVAAFCSRPSALEIREDWARIFSDGVLQLTLDSHNYSEQEKNTLRTVWRIIYRSPSGRPSIVSLLRVSSIQAVGIVDLINRPKESLAPKLSTAQAIATPTATKVMGRKDDWKGFGNAVKHLIENQETLFLPPLRWLAEYFNVSNPGLWSHFPELSLSYKTARAQQIRNRLEKAQRGAVRVAFEIVSSNESRGLETLVRRDGLEVALRASVTKEIAEQSIKYVVASFREVMHSRISLWFQGGDYPDKE